MQAAQAGPDDRLRVGGAIELGPHRLEGIADRPLLETQILQGREGIGPRHRGLGRRDGPIGGAIAVIEAEAADRVALDDQAAVVLGGMVGRAQRDQPLRIVRAAFATTIQMVHLDERRMGAARYGTTATVAAQHLAADCRRDRLRGSPAGAGLGVRRTDVLGIA
jgi:hypothetical protein